MEGELAGGITSAVLLGIVEGITEFLPISSTGHLIVTAHLLGETSEAAKLFEIVIQLGAILAVCWHYRQRLLRLISRFFRRHTEEAALAKNLLIAFLPAAVAGLLVHDLIKRYLFSPQTVAVALIIGGIIILIVERRTRPPRMTELHAIKPQTALLIGMAQSLALFPGVSRAGATIIGGLLCGLNRQTATEFSFLLALPTMFAAASFDLWANADLLSLALVKTILWGFAVSFVAALLTIRLLLAFVAKHKFTVFGWYRIAFGIIILSVV